VAEPLTMKSVKDILLFPFRGAEWRGRFLIGSALVLAGYVIPIVPLLFVCGYALQIMRRVAQGEDPALLPWDEWGRYAVDGVRSMAAAAIYLLPGFVVLAAGMGLYFASSFAMPGMYENQILSSDPESVWPWVFLGGMSAMFLSMFLGTVLLAIGAAPLPMALAHLAMRDQFSAAFHPREWWPRVRANAAGYFAAWVVAAGLAAMLYFASTLLSYSVILCCVSPFLSAAGGFYLSLVSAALFGQFYRDSMEAPVAEAPPLLFDEDLG